LADTPAGEDIATEVTEPHASLDGADQAATDRKNLEERFVSRTVEAILIGVVALFSVLLTLITLSRSVDLYFPADAAHYVGDADALFGHGVRGVRHPLLFPALLGLFQPFAGAIGAFQLSMGVAAFLLPVSQYLLLRQWLAPIPSLAGAALGSLTPSVGELFGWGGGATLIGLDFMILSIAFMELWIRKRGKQGIFVGLFVGLTALSHPLIFGATLFVLLVRWAFHGLTRPSLSTDWSPAGARGIGSFLAVTGGLFLFSANYYLQLKTPGQAGSANFGLPGQLLLWTFRENAFALFFLFLGLLLPLPLRKRSLFVVTASIGALFVGIPVFTSWDLSYSSRVVYFLPIVFGVGGGLLAYLILEQVRDTPGLRRFEAPVIVGLVLAATIGPAYGLGYVERVQFASAYYQRVDVVDLPAFEYLRGGTGTVATSWPRAFQDEGSVNAWFVEALSKRPALGPGAPWLSTLTTVGPAELDMQRLFSGSIGFENGAVQISGTRTGGLRDPAINVEVGGFYYPSVYLNSYASEYPLAVEEGVNATIAGDSLVLRHPALQGAAELLQESRLNQSGVDITFTMLGANATAGTWAIWIWPAYFRAWEDVQSEGGGLRTIQSYRSAVITSHFQALTAGSSLRYVPVDPRWGIQGIEVQANGTDTIKLKIGVDGGDPVGALRSFDEGTLIAQYDVTNILLWRDTGWGPRFDVSPKFRQSFETPNLIVYEVVT